MFVSQILLSLATSFFKLIGIAAFFFKGKTNDFAIIDKLVFLSYFKKNQIRSLYDHALKVTQMERYDNFLKQCRHYSLHQMAVHALKNSNGHDVAECGCWKGHSTYIIATILKEHQFKKKFHVFDSFEGLSALQKEDKNDRRNLSPKEVSELRQSFITPLEKVKENLKEFSFIRYYPGWIPDKFSEVKASTFSFIHITVDLFQPTMDSIKFFYPLLIKGGVMVISDYGLTQFPGVSRAVNGFLQEMDQPCSFFYEIPTGGAFLIK